MIVKIYDLIKVLTNKITDKPLVFISLVEASIRITFVWPIGFHTQKVITYHDALEFQSDEKAAVLKMIKEINERYAQHLASIV